MEENKNVNEDAGLNEEDLEEVAGGGGMIPKNVCQFTKGDRSKQVDGNTWLKCNSTCALVISCSCRNKGQCVDNWHMINSDKTLYPTGFANHNRKTPPSYNT